MEDLSTIWKECLETSNLVPKHRNDDEATKNSNADTEAEDFSAENFLGILFHDGGNFPCDKTSKSFNEHTALPPFYNEELYIRGQEFYRKHMFAISFSTLLGLISLLTSPSSKVLLMTNRSSTPLTAYKRYVATLFYTLIWYEKDFRPGSSLWSSIKTVKSMHNSASKKSTALLNYSINQRDMATTLFGFMGYAVAKPEMVGIHNATDEELKSFIHLWRVVGYLMGVEDRFNICRESVKETREICKVIIEKVGRYFLNNPAEDFNTLYKALIQGIGVMNPMIDHDLYLYYIEVIMENTSAINLKKDNWKPLSSGTKLKLKLLVFHLWSLQFAILRVFSQYLVIIGFWFLKKLSFLSLLPFRKEKFFCSYLKTFGINL